MTGFPGSTGAPAGFVAFATDLEGVFFAFCAVLDSPWLNKHFDRWQDGSGHDAEAKSPRERNIWSGYNTNPRPYGRASD